MTIDLIEAGILQGLILAIISLGVMIPFRVLNFSDLTGEGAYPLGGAVCASLLINNVSQGVAIFFAAISGGLLAICTAQVAMRMKVNSLLAGIILSTMAYSINLRIMHKPNIALFDIDGYTFDILILTLIVCICSVVLLLFLYTDFGLRLRAIGMNPKFAESYSISENKYTSLGLFISGSLFGLSGALIVQVQQFMDINIGIGIVIHGLASLMIGECIIGNNTIFKQLCAPIFGAIIYQQIQGLVLAIGLSPVDLKFFTGIIVLFSLYVSRRSL